MTKKIIAILMTLTFIFAFAACGGKEEPQTTEADTEVTDEVTEAPTEATEATEATEPAETTEADTEATETETTEAASATEESKEAAESTSAKETEKETTEAKTEKEKTPATKEEIVAYFNTAVNAVKTDAKTVVSPYSDISLAGNAVLPSAINGVLKLLGGADEFLGDQLSKNSRKESETYSTKDAIKASFPVEGEAWASKLTPADVKSATCTEKDGKYIITIVTVADGKSESVKHGEGHAPKALNVVLPGIVNDNIPGVAKGIAGTAAMDYPSSTIKVTVDKETGKAVSAQYDLYWTINFDKIGVIIPFLTSTVYEIKY